MQSALCTTHSWHCNWLQLHENCKEQWCDSKQSYLTGIHAAATFETFQYYAWPAASFCTPDTVVVLVIRPLCCESLHSITAWQLLHGHPIKASGPECKIATHWAGVFLNQVLCGAVDANPVCTHSALKPKNWTDDSQSLMKGGQPLLWPQLWF